MDVSSLTPEEAADRLISGYSKQKVPLGVSINRHRDEKMIEAKALLERAMASERTDEPESEDDIDTRMLITNDGVRVQHFGPFSGNYAALYWGRRNTEPGTHLSSVMWPMDPDLVDGS